MLTELQEEMGSPMAHEVHEDRTTYLFGSFRFSPAKQLLLRDGVPVRIGARALDILTLLIRQPGQLVSKAQLQDFVWPDTFVHESNLKVNIAALRRALSDPSAETSYIASIPRRGYKFTGTVQAVTEVNLNQGRQALVARRPFPTLPTIIGRSAEIMELTYLLVNSPCVTIAGPGGVGKTTVAIAVAHQVKEQYGGATYFVDLATVGDSQFVANAIANAVGVRRSDDDPITGIINVLQGHRVLVVVDNCEHLIATVSATASRLLAALPDLKILATSREPLGIATELLYRLPTLRFPEEASGLTVSHAMTFPAIELFVTRANQHGYYSLADADVPLVSSICKQLDGIALAIELAASKTAAFGVPKLLAMLEQRFQLLSHGPREAPLRQQTLLATLDWSYRLLSEDEAALLRTLSVFVGVFRLDDAIAIAEAIGMKPQVSVRALERLTTRSLVATEYRHGAFLYRLLESTRAYAGERLIAEGEYDRVIRIFASHILTLFERADAEWRKRDKQEWVAEYNPRIDDLRKVLSWALDDGNDQRLGVALTAAAIPLWEELSLVREFRSRVSDALAAVRQFDECPVHVRMKLAWSRASGMNFAHPLVEETGKAWLHCYELGVEGGSVEFQLRGLWGLAVYLIYTGKSLEAVSRLNQFIEIAEENNEAWAIPEGERLLAMAEIYLGHLQVARERLERLAVQYESDQGLVRNTRYNLDQLVAIKCSLALALWLVGESTSAMHMVHEATERADAIDHVVSRSNLLALGAIPIAFWTGDLGSADRYVRALGEDGRREYIEIWARFHRFYDSALKVRKTGQAALPELKAHLDELIAWGFTARAPVHYCMLAEGFLHGGRLDLALDAIDEAKKYAEAPGEAWCLPEILRVDAVLQFRLGNLKNAEELLRAAIKHARAIGAVTLEVRAIMALASGFESDKRLEEAIRLLDVSCKSVKSHSGFGELANMRNRLRKLQKGNRSFGA